MNFQNLARKALPYIVALAVFWAVSALYFAPQLSGDTLSMHDVEMYGGMKADISAHRAATGEDPQWTGGMFGGMPAYLISVNYPAMIIRNAVQRALSAMGEPVSMMFLAMAGFWLMLVLCGVNPWLSIPFAVAYGLSTYNILIIEAGHVTKMRAMGYAPILVGAVWWTFRRDVWIGGALAALAGTLLVAASHHQITYYFLMVVAAMWINEFAVTIRDKGLGADVIAPGSGMRRKAPGQIGKFSPYGSVKLFSVRGGWGRFWTATAVLVAAAVLSVGANFTHIWYTFEHTPETTRGGSEVAAVDPEVSADERSGLDLEYATAWSYGVGESLNMLIPNLRGGASGGGFRPDGEVATVLRASGYDPAAATTLPGYWGEQPMTGGPTYLGAAMVFMFVLGMMVLPARQKWWILAVSAVALLMAWGRNAMWFTELSFAVLPGYNKFRTVSMALAVLQWSAPFVAALVAGELWRGAFAGREAHARFMKGLAWSAGVTGGTALLFALLGGWMFDFSTATDAYLPEIPRLAEAMHAERASMLASDAWRSLLMVVLAAGIVWWWAAAKAEKAAKHGWAAAVALTAVVLVDLVPVDLRFLSHDDFRTPSQVKIVPDEADLAIMEDKESGFRVLNTENPFNEARTSYFHRSVGGYHGAKLRRYQDVIDRYLSQFDRGVLDALNTKYFIVADPQTGARSARPNPGAFGAAWFVDGVEFTSGAAAELDAIGATDLRRTAVVDRRFEQTVGTAGTEGLSASYLAMADSLSTDRIALTEYHPNHLIYASRAERDRVAVFSEIYYDKGWRAYIDGREVPYLRADYILRAMTVPAGDHIVEWRFRAPRFAEVEGVTMACSVLVLVWLAAAVATKTYRRKKEEAQA